MKKTTVIVIIAIIILGIIVGVMIFNKEENPNKKFNEINGNEISNVIGLNQVTNEVVNNQIENTVNNDVQNKEENNVSSEIITENPKTLEEKAVDIAKNDYGAQSNIQFSFEGQNAKGEYIVSVRDASSTEALAFYTINVSNNTFTKKVLNNQ